MRSFLALMFFAPIAMGIAVQNGAEFVTPLVIVMSCVALAMFVFEKQRRA